MRGLGTLVNVAAVLAGSGLGLILRGRLTQRTRAVVTDGLGLLTLLIAALNTASVRDPALRRAVGPSAPVLIVLGAVLIGGIVGSLLHLETRLHGLGEHIQRRLTGTRARAAAAPSAADPVSGDLVGTAAPAPGTSPAGTAGRAGFVEGFVTASLVFCVGPLAILGALQDGLGRGIDQLALKATLDGFASVAFAASLGAGVAAAALPVLVYQGGLTAVGFLLGGLLPDAQIATLTATGGLLLVGISLQLLRIRRVAVADLLPALVVAPVITAIVTNLR